MGYTQFGLRIKEIRAEHNEVMADMAKALDVSIPFLSAVENGKKNIPNDWLDTLSKHYSLSEEEKEQLKQAIEESKIQIKINLVHADNQKRKLAFQFQRSFENLNEEKIDKISKILEEES